MIRPLKIGLAIVLISGCSGPVTEDTSLAPPLSGFEFLTEETQRLQQNSFENPGYLWVEKGESLFQEEAQDSPSCMSCHSNDDLKPVATYYPKYDKASKRLINLETRINLCRTEHQSKPALAYESEDLLALTIYVTNLAEGERRAVKVTHEIRKNYISGQNYFRTRRGQLNLSCAQCHDQNWGKQLRGDVISQGQSNGFPAYRFEWESLGSLHRRFADCDRGVRAEPLELGSQTYTDLELYLALRGQGLAIEAPAVRR